MSINGVDITKEFSTICSSVWIVLYIALIWFVWTRKPTTLVGRRWKASWLIGGLPILGMPVIMVPITIIIMVFHSDFANFNLSNLSENLLDFFSSMMALVCIAIPISSFIVVFAIFGTYFKFRSTLDYWLDKIVPPSKDEKTDEVVWY